MSLTVTMKEDSGYELHEEGEWYEGIIASIEEAEDRGFGPGLKWIINLDGEADPISGDPRDTWAFTSQKLSPRSKLFKWVKGVVGEGNMPAPGGTLDLTAIVGARVKVMFEQGPGTDSEGNPVTKEKVVNVKTATAGGSSTFTNVPSASVVNQTPAQPTAAQPEPF